MKQIAYGIGVFLLTVGSAAVFLYTRLSVDYRTKAFYKDTYQILSKINNPAPDFGTVPHERLPSGSWFAVELEHECCTGLGFSAVLLKDSEGNVYSAENNYCTVVDFASQLHCNTEISDIPSLREKLLQMGFRQGLPSY